MVDPMRFSEQYDPMLPRDRPAQMEYDEWLDTLDHHTVGECECCQCMGGPVDCVPPFGPNGGCSLSDDEDVAA